ncbi:hypothetical protein Scep_023264 [Stephania cephalantha]|uniref:Protein kinase domain-containing protein n=1 Tax=Stephania cephalantha TaxID=152367 RepID=A0AAP0F3D0_9MAGN
MKLSLANDLASQINNNRAIAAPQQEPVVKFWQIDAVTMEQFLLDIAREKPVRFTAQQLCGFTNNYSTRLGSGGFGIVYKGQFPNGMQIAVKVLSRSSGKAVEEQFMAEVGTIGRTHHINLVRLYGFSFDHIMSALVYEYMDNGSLDKFLFSETSSIEWEKLEEIAIGTAKGLAYLHHDCQKRIIHYDIKPGNVLLDANFSPKVADFGLATLGNRDSTHVSVTGYRGTPGYSAPEFLFKNHPITHKCDVYSFGMLLFEIVRKKRNTDVSPSSSLKWFPKQVWEGFDKGSVGEMIKDQCGIEDKDREKAERMLMVALWCAQDSPEDRPSMNNVVKMLEGGVQIPPPPKTFQYLYSPGVGIPMICYLTGSDSNYSITTRSNSSPYYGEATPIMRKYEIEIAQTN